MGMTRFPLTKGTSTVISFLSIFGRVALTLVQRLRIISEKDDNLLPEKMVIGLWSFATSAALASVKA